MHFTDWIEFITYANYSKNRMRPRIYVMKPNKGQFFSPAGNKQLSLSFALSQKACIFSVNIVILGVW